MSVPPDFEDALGESLDVIDRELAKDEVPLRDRPLRAARDFVTYCVMQVAVGEEITEPGKFLDYMASDWFKAQGDGHALQTALYTLTPFYLIAIALFLWLARLLRREETRA